MNRLYITLLFHFVVISSVAQVDSCRFMFYNVENLFDTIDNPDTRDDEFLPQGDRHWNSWKYQTKLNQIYKVVMATKKWEKLSLIGLCEIENEAVLNQLLYKTPLFQHGYKVIHKDSPDERGIDVALLYRADDFELINYQYFPVIFEDDSTDKTRDMLYVKGLLFGSDTLHVFLNHWPSRYGGYAQTAPKRAIAANLLVHKTDSIMQNDSLAAIIIAGDFNDEPDDESISTLLIKLRGRIDKLNPAGIQGTTKYRSQWYFFDQILVSEKLMNRNSQLFVKDMQIGTFPFLLMDDERYGGKKPFRTYLGPRYLGGYSDHLPVFVDIVKPMPTGE